MDMDIPPETTIWQPAGCQHCSFTGYHGRTGIHELLLIDDRIRTAIYQGEGELGITRLAGESLSDAAWRRATKGTSR